MPLPWTRLEGKIDLHMETDDTRFETLIAKSDQRHAENIETLQKINTAIRPENLTLVVQSSIKASRKKAMLNTGAVVVATLVALGGMFPLLQWAAGFTIAWVAPAVKAEMAQPAIPNHPVTPGLGPAPSTQPRASVRHD